jgi:GNAT superfamily N-acetyltransferase
MAAEAGWRFEPLGAGHGREGFDCGEPALDEFLHRFARQNQEKGISRTVVVLPPGESRIAGYFTLSLGSLEFSSLPEEDRRRLPRYPIPVVHLGRLAVDRRDRGKGLGALLVAAALQRALAVSETAGAYAVEVLAKGEDAAAFYAHFGFRPLVDDPLRLYLRLDRVRGLYGRP